MLFEEMLHLPSHLCIMYVCGEFYYYCLVCLTEEGLRVHVFVGLRGYVWVRVWVDTRRQAGGRRHGIFALHRGT